MKDANDDPLNIGNVYLAEPKSIAFPKIVFITPNVQPQGNVDLFSVTKSHKRRTSLYHLNESTTPDLIRQNSELIPTTTPHSTSLMSMNTISKPKLKNSISDKYDFHQYIIKDIGGTKPTRGLAMARQKLFDRSIDVLNQIFNDIKKDINISVLSRSDEMVKHENWISRLQSLRRRGLAANRKLVALHLIFHRKMGEIESLKTKTFRKNIEKTVLFIDYLRNMSKTVNFLPLINTEKFQSSFIAEPKKIQKLGLFCQKIEMFLKQREIMEISPENGTFCFSILHPDTKSGKIIRRFEENIENLSYDNVVSIIGHLTGPTQNDFTTVENILFDLAWQLKPFPFGLKRKTNLPDVSDLFPAVFEAIHVPREFSFVSFSSLNGIVWPFKSAVDAIFDMMIQTNPFETARIFWHIVEKAAECMKNVLIMQGTKAEDVEIDFDGLFPMLMICVFVFGNGEWIDIALYTISFNEHIGDDPQLQFAMTYLEGLVTQILALDVPTLKKRANALRKKWADEESDPLGIRNGC